MAMGMGAFAMIVRASASAVGRTSAAGTTRFTSPSRAASRPSKNSPVMISSLARASPTVRGRKCVTPPVQKSPTPDLREGELRVLGRHHQVAVERQLAAAAHRVPVHGTMMGFGIDFMSTVTCWISFTNSRISATPPWPRADSFRSSPAQNARPSPERIATRTAGSLPTACNAWCRSRISWGTIALSRCGRLRRMRAMPSRTSYRTVSSVMDAPP